MKNKRGQKPIPEKKHLKIGNKHPSKYWWSLGLMLSEFNEVHMTSTRKTYHTMKLVVDLSKTFNLKCSEPTNITITEGDYSIDLIKVVIKIK